jgi:hypothetical protein
MASAGRDRWPEADGRWRLPAIDGFRRARISMQLGVSTHNPPIAASGGSHPRPGTVADASVVPGTVDAGHRRPGTDADGGEDLALESMEEPTAPPARRTHRA